jgi:hypothetical protein
LSQQVAADKISKEAGSKDHGLTILSLINWPNLIIVQRI